MKVREGRIGEDDTGDGKESGKYVKTQDTMEEAGGKVEKAKTMQGTKAKG